MSAVTSDQTSTIGKTRTSPHVTPTPSVAPAPRDFLVVEHVSKSYIGRKGSAPVTVLDDVSLTAGSREFVVIIGPSGCGKSTLMSCIAGLTEFEDGTIRIGESVVEGPGPESAVVFQAASLLPWKSVRQNIAYGLELRRTASKAEIATRVEKALVLVGLENFADHYPHEISGGMQQRVNLARALVVEASLILMDEPFGALDALTKETLQDELSSLIGHIDRATVFITHDIREAIYLADKVVVMSPRPGRIVREIKVPFPRPRSRELTLTPEFEEIALELRSMLH